MIPKKLTPPNFGGNIRFSYRWVRKSGFSNAVCLSVSVSVCDTLYSLNGWSDFAEILYLSPISLCEAAIWRRTSYHKNYGYFTGRPENKNFIFSKTALTILIKIHVHIVPMGPYYPICVATPEKFEFSVDAILNIFKFNATWDLNGWRYLIGIWYSKTLVCSFQTQQIWTVS